MIDPSRVRISGALQPFATGFADELARQGYRAGSQAQQLRLMAHVSRWLGSNDLDVADVPAMQSGSFKPDGILATGTCGQAGRCDRC